jgi:uncharacterized protein YmfQ (DUF2313 family)
MAIADKILALTKQLYPEGRAFKMPDGGYLEGLHRALALSEEQAWNDAVGILNNILPDNSGFTSEDATAWERRLGIASNNSVSLSDRKAAIQRKLNHPGIVKSRQSWLYLQGQLQAAGFDVYVHENRFDDGAGGYETQNPLDVTSGSGEFQNQHGDFEHGEQQHGGWYENIIANHIEEDRDSVFDLGDNFRSTFFIGGQTFGDFADVDEDRKTEFRQLILRIKPVQTVGILLINYV